MLLPRQSNSLVPRPSIQFVYFQGSKLGIDFGKKTGYILVSLTSNLLKIFFNITQ